ncbi:MAG: hypothetical protein HC773_00895 [Scytonema sp. CRU_2_7]|nr:hypothetical protein [Scytonema sp. CRU_2_7]
MIEKPPAVDIKVIIPPSITDLLAISIIGFALVQLAIHHPLNQRSRYIRVLPTSPIERVLEQLNL